MKINFMKIEKIISISILICTSLCSTSAHETITNKDSITNTVQDISNEKKLNYINEKYIINKNKSNDFQEVYGDPKNAPNIILTFTSMACPVCAEHHNNILPELLKKYVNSGKLAVIVRDYPADPLSLKASAVVWANHQTDPKLTLILREKLFKPEFNWVSNNMEDALSAIKHYAKSECSNNKEKKAIDVSTDNEKLMQAVFDKRVDDKKALNITEVPTIFLVIKKGEDVKNWKLEQIQNSVDLPAIEKLLEDNLSK